MIRRPRKGGGCWLLPCHITRDPTDATVGVQANTLRYRHAIWVKTLRGFRNWDVPVGVVFVRIEEDDRWVVLAADPEIKIDNHHEDRIPHLHVDGWQGEDRRDLHPTLGPEEAARAIRHHLVEQGYIDIARLLEELR